MNHPTSAALHQAVQAFLAAPAAGPSFDDLALALARHQAASSAPIARLYRARGLDPASLGAAAEIPAVPTDAFKMTRIAAHRADNDTVLFRTSGTTVGARGAHGLRDTSTYVDGALRHGAAMLAPDRPAGLTILALMPEPGPAPESSLGFMCQAFGGRIGRAGGWFIKDGALDVAGLDRAREEAPGPVLLLATSFALVFLLDELGGRRLPLPPGSRVMQTGGYKGKSREVPAGELRSRVSEALGVDEPRIVNEYGMTELSSQAYEGTLRAALGFGSAGPGVLVEPPWMRVTPVDPVTLAPVPEGDTGIARIVDLANVDSAVAIQTQDLVRRRPGGFELLGRAPGAIPRGCSLAMEELLGSP
jgi:hypothetical protein